MPRPAPDGRTLKSLRELQRLAGGAIMRPLSPADTMQETWIDGRPMEEVTTEFIKPNDRLTSFERIEIYNKQYWFRLLDILWDDYPGLRAVMGDQKFYQMTREYLERYPSRSFTLRNLGGRIEQFLRERPGLIAPRHELALDMARFEWAQVVAFDGPEKPVVGVDDLLGKDPAEVRLALQPYMSVMELAYPLDEFLISVKKGSSAMRSEASNAMEEGRKSRRTRKIPLPRRKKIHLVVHRYRLSLYYKRIDHAAYAALTALRDGESLADACERAIEVETKASVDWGVRLKGWFEIWTRLGWFCKWK